MLLVCFYFRSLSQSAPLEWFVRWSEEREHAIRMDKRICVFFPTIVISCNLYTFHYLVITIYVSTRIKAAWFSAFTLILFIFGVCFCDRPIHWLIFILIPMIWFLLVYRQRCHSLQFFFSFSIPFMNALISFQLLEFD